jgi:outer membrane receptor for ferrienterochelin and colicins
MVAVCSLCIYYLSYNQEKTMKKTIILAICLLNLMALYSQIKIEGTISEFDKNNKPIGLPGATVQWIGTTKGTSTDVNGNFSLMTIHGINKIVVKHVSYETDTLTIANMEKPVKILLTGGKNLKAVEIRSSEGIIVSIKSIPTQIITGDGLRKAACCSLAESFESSATVDVEYSDAVTGAKQIQMLGLAGVYTQILAENIPLVRGLSTPFGLSYVPGPWMESIYISKGTSSVTNGYESITGQINVEYKKPESNEEKVYLNLYGDQMGRGELNFNSRIGVKKNVSTMLLLHAENQFSKIDHNHDMFLDIPLSKQVHVMNRWDYDVPNKLEGKAIVSFLTEDRSGGAVKFDKSKDYLDTTQYGMGIKTNRFNVTTKNGFFLKGDDRSIGTMLSFTHHDQNSFFGQTKYVADQNSLYANFLYASPLSKNKNHKINTGVSYQMDAYKENFNDSAFSHIESVPGVFAQYSYSVGDALAIIAGFRADYHNQFGLFWTPRMHAKYMLNEHWAVRGTVGKGYRVANVYAENTALLTSSRQFVVTEKLKNEEAWNYGLNITRTFNMNKKDATIAIDYYRTEFVNQVIIDVDKSPDFAYLSNLHGLSYSNSAQIEAILYPIKSLEMTLAYRINDVWQTTNGKLQEKPLASKHKAVMSLSYKTKYDKWQFDFTTQYHGAMRLPDLSANPVAYQLPKHSPDYFIFNAQITRRFKKVEYYIGAENLGNFTQKTPIIASHHPFGDYFDSSIVWGPIKGRMIYGGLRFTLKS